MVPSLEDIGERGLIRLIREAFPSRHPGVVLGIGDDAAVVRPGRGSILLTKDLLVEDVDFRRDRHPAFFIGRKSVAVNLSDIAAMGGQARFALLGLALPGDLPLAWAKEFLAGFRTSVRRYGVELVGGDISLAREIVISVTLVGRSGRFARRGGARAGDEIYVSGTLGDAALGFDLIDRGFRKSGRGAPEKIPPWTRAGWRELARRTGWESPPARGPVRAFLDPQPRLVAAERLLRSGLPTAMIDVSDGLSVDLMHLCRESGTGAVIDLSAIPLSRGMRLLGGAKTLDYGLNGGEDFELLLTVRPTRGSEALIAALQRPLRLTRIGRMKRGRGIEAIRPDGIRETLAVRGYEHFR